MQGLKDEIFYQVALGFIQGIGAKRAAALMAVFGSAREVFDASLKQLMHVDGLGEVAARAIKNPEVFLQAEQEMAFVQAKQIQVLLQNDPAFPRRLLQCSDAPQLLYYKGCANLNAARVVAVIGTRKNTEYGQRATNDLIEGLSRLENIIVVSGLAHGIDTIAHKAALKQGLGTVGVLGHGLNTIYPAANRNLAREMLEQDGGLLTEFSSVAAIDKGNFPARNRIVAGISDVTVIVESDIKGGALITAYIANSYNREVAAFPGRSYDTKSSGTNMLIRKNLASSISSSEDLAELMGWQKRKKKVVRSTPLLLHLSVEEQKVMELLRKKDITHSDELLQHTGMNNSQLASCLLMLEMQDLIKTLPGKFYRLN